MKTKVELDYILLYLNEIYKKMPYRYFPIEFSSYEDYVKYLKEKGFALEVPKEIYNSKI